MPLPKLSYPSHAIVVPSTGKEVLFRPFVAREEKILLTAKQEGTLDAVARAVVQIIENCAMDSAKFSVDKLSIFDAEWIFLKLRQVSVSNVVEQEYQDGEDEKIYRVRVDLDKVDSPAVNADSELSGFAVLVDKGMTAEFKWPGIDLLADPGLNGDGEIDYDKVLSKCFKRVYTDTSSSSPDNEKEALEWIQSVPISVMDSMKEGIDKMPRMKFTVNYTNSKGTARTFELRRLLDFFALL